MASLEDRALRRLIREDPIGPAWDDFRELCFSGDLSAAEREILAVLALVDPDEDDWLCSFGVNVLEPLISHRGDESLPLIRAAIGVRGFRRALSCVWSSGLSTDGEQELASLKPAEGSLDDIGRRS